MTKQLREVESNGVMCRWNPDKSPYSRAEVFAEAGWRTAVDDEAIDHADAFKQVREQPYVVDAVVEAIREYERYSESGSPESLAATIRPLVLDSTPTEELVKQLEKRGGKDMGLRADDEMRWAGFRHVLTLLPTPTPQPEQEG